MRLLSLFLVSVCAFAQARFEMWPGTQYDPAIPTVKKVLGYETGERIASHGELMKYFEALAAAAPNRIKIFEYAQSWEKRKLIYAAIGSDSNVRRLDDIKASMKKLADPRKTADAEAKKLTASLPAVIMLAYNVHGNEISGPDAAMMTAYHLLAARNDAIVSSILQNVLVLIDPTQNPDGRDRFVNSFTQAEGLVPDANPVSAEHNEPWPGGRSNHYLFDMNRDWFALTQPETRGRIKLCLDWYPLVFVDLHEMGGDTTYYFAPEAVPFNPHIEKNQRQALDWFGRNNAKWFDHYGFSYFTREVFDAFYPGYGASWPTYYGSVAMTYENASARGLLYQRNDETTFTFQQSVQKHFVASVATAETAAKNRVQLLENFWNYRKTAIEEGQKDATKEYVLVRKGDTALVDKLAHLLAEQGIEVRQARDKMTVSGKEVPAGSYAIALAQPMKRMIRTLLDPEVPMEADFLKEQERRRKKKLRDEIYDVTGWSLPLQYNVECLASPAALSGNFTPVQPGAVPGKVTGKGTVAYLVPWGSVASARFTAQALREGLKLHTTDKSFTQNGRKFPEGTVIVKVKENAADAAAKVEKIARESGAEVVGTETGWVEEGVNFGSNYVFALRPLKIAMAWDAPTSSLSAGHTRYVIERQLGYPVTIFRARALAMADLSKYHVLVLPDAMGGYANDLGPAGIARLKSWVASGGVLIGIGNSVAFLADPRVGLLAVQVESLARAGEAPKKPETPTDVRTAGKLITKQEEFDKAIQADQETPDDVAGVLVRAKVDTESWIGAGAAETVHVLVNGRNIYTPIKTDRGINAAVFEAPDKLLASGYLWEENRKQLAFKPFVIVGREGRGMVVGFTADPNFRAYMDGLNVLFMNALLRGPARTGRGFGEQNEW